MDDGHESRVIDTVLSLTDTAVRDFDTTDMLTTLTQRCVELLDVSAACVVLVDGKGRLSVAAASSERARLLEVFAVAIEAGPGIRCARSGRTVTSGDLAAADAQQVWPRYTQGAEAAGFRAVHAVPMRLREEVAGALTLLHTDPGAISDADARTGRSLADAATVGLLHERALRRSETTCDQLQGALDSRVIIEQAKGVLSHQGTVTPDDAFTVLRSHARNHGLRLNELAQNVVAGTVDLTSIVRPAL